MARAPPCPSDASALTGWPASSWWRFSPVITNNPSPHVATSTVRVVIGGSYSAPADQAITAENGVDVDWRRRHPRTVLCERRQLRGLRDRMVAARLKVG